MTWPNPARVLIATTDPARAQALRAWLERLELRVASEQVADMDALTTALARSRWDLLLCCHDADSPLAPNRVLNLFRGTSDGVALLLEQEAELTLLAEGLRAGAHDVLLPGEDDRLLPVLRREFERLELARAGQQQARQLQVQAERIGELERALQARPPVPQRESLAVPDSKPAAPAAPQSRDADASAPEILQLLADHIHDNTLVLLFQPTVCLRGDEREHYEVYLRMPGRDGHLLAPDAFMHLAEQAGMGGRIDRWVVLHALRRLASHREQRPDACLTINLTHAAYTDPRFLPWLKLALQAAHFPKEAVILQIAEPLAAQEQERAAIFTRALSQLNCMVSLSHFGTSEDPFRTLNALHIDYVKLAGQFVLEHIQNDAGRLALQSLLRQLQSDGFRTVVPMVSDVSILARLFQAGATHVQGNYFAEPGREMDYEFYTRVGLV